MRATEPSTGTAENGEIEAPPNLDLIGRELAGKNVEPDKRAKEGDEQYAKNQKDRDDREKSVFHKAFVFFIILGAGLVAASVVVFMWHLLAPEKWHWLTDEQIDRINTFVFGSAAGGLLKTYARRSLLGEKAP